MLITLAVWDFILFFLTVFVIDFEIFLKSNVKVSVKKEKTYQCLLCRLQGIRVFRKCICLDFNYNINFLS